jgi:hypothetical protein
MHRQAASLPLDALSASEANGGERRSGAPGASGPAPPRGGVDSTSMEEKSSGTSFGMRVLAAIVLALAAWFLLKIVIGIVAGVAYFVAVIVAIVAVVWAARTLF